MSRKYTIDLVWPIAGIDRSISFQRQPPYTTPDALNVRADETRTYRERGGSRPGLGLGMRTKLPAAARLLTKVSVIKATWPKNYSPYLGFQLRDSVNNVSWASAPTYSQGQGFQGYDGGLIGGPWGISLTQPNYTDPTRPYQLMAFISPNGEAYSGELRVYVGLPNESDDPADGSLCVGVIFSNGTYQGFSEEFVGGSSTGRTLGTVYSDNPNSPGPFSVAVNPTTKQVTAYWRYREVASQVASTLGGSAAAIEVTSDTIEAKKIAWDASVSTTLLKTYDDLRRDILVAVSNGRVYMEDDANTLKLIDSTSRLASDVDLVAADREQLLYIADYGVAATGTGGIVAGPDYNVLTGVSLDPTVTPQDYTLEITDSNYSQNTKQLVELENATGGTFRLSYRGQYTDDIPYNAAASFVKAELQSLSAIDLVEVEGDAGGPWEVEFKGTLAGGQVDDLGYDAIDLTHDTATPDVSITLVQVGAGGEYFRGQYAISSVSPGSVGFNPPLPVEEGYAGVVGAIRYNIIRTPKIFDARKEEVRAHVASKGVVPAGCRCVAMYRDRVVYGGSDLQPNVFNMSRQGDPNDWDYAAEDSAAAVSAQASVAGQLADPITALIPHGDECLIVGCYNSLWIVKGDPGYGGSLDPVSYKIGIVSSNAWCKTPDNMMVFMSHDGLYVIPAGCEGFPASISRERIPSELLCLSASRESINLEYDTSARGVHIFVTKRDGSESAHWWLDWEAKSFWRVKLQSDHEPYAAHERVVWDDCPAVLVAGRDGYIRYFDRIFQVDDGGNEIESYCDIGPFHLSRGALDEGILAELRADLGYKSGPVDWEVRAGDGSEAAFNEQASREEGTWSREGLAYNARPRVRGVCAIVRVSNGTTNRRWFLERITASICSAGRRRVR